MDKNNLNDDLMNDDLMNDEYIDKLLEETLTDFALEEGERLMKEAEELEGFNPPEFSDEYKRKINKLMGRNYYKIKKRRRPAILKFAAVIALCFVVSMPIAYSANADFRLFFKNLFKDFGTHYDVTQTVTDQDYDFSAIPDSWEYFYVPEYVPAGYKIDSIEADNNIIKFKYISDKYTLSFNTYSDKKITKSFDSEHIETKEVNINSNDGHIVYNVDNTDLFWNNETRTFKLSFNDTSINDSEIIKMAESLEIVSK